MPQFNQPSSDFSFFGEDPFTDIARGVGSGILGAAEGIGSLLGFDIEDNFGLFDDPQGLLGNLVGGLSQFAIGFGIGGAALKATSRLGKYAKMARVSKAADKLITPTGWKSRMMSTGLKSAVADGLVFPGHGGRLADMMKDVPGVGDFVPEFLTSDEDDSELEARMKNVLEGAMLGTAIDGVMEVFGAVRRSYKAGMKPQGLEESQFTELAAQQRGAPEKAMLGLQRALGGGSAFKVVEHVGDLIHRMTDDLASGGFNDISDKVNKILRYLGPDGSFEREFRVNMENNASSMGRSLDEYTAEVQVALKKYGEEFGKLKPLNEAHELALDAVKAVADADWDQAAKHVRKLQDQLKRGKDHWQSYVFQGLPGRGKTRARPQLLEDGTSFQPEQGKFYRSFKGDSDDVGEAVAGDAFDNGPFMVEVTKEGKVDPESVDRVFVDADAYTNYPSDIVEDLRKRFPNADIIDVKRTEDGFVVSSTRAAETEVDKAVNNLIPDSNANIRAAVLPLGEDADDIVQATRGMADWDPDGGRVILSVEGQDIDGAYRGADRLSDLNLRDNPDEGGYTVLQLDKEARIIDAESSEARKLLGGGAVDMSAEERMELLVDIVRESGSHDAVRMGKHNYVVVNSDSITHSIQKLPGAPFHQTRDAAKHVHMHVPKTVENSETIKMLARMSLSTDDMVSLARGIEEQAAVQGPPNMEKIFGRLNISKMSGRDVHLLHLAIQKRFEGIKISKTNHEEMTKDAMEQVSKMTGTPLLDLASQNMRAGKRVEQIGIRWQSGKMILQQYSEDILNMQRALLKYEDAGFDALSSAEKKLAMNSVPDAETGQIRPLSKEELAEKLSQLVHDVHYFAESLGYVGNKLGVALNRGRLSVDVMDAAGLRAAMEHKGAGTYEHILKVTRKSVDASENAAEALRGHMMGAGKWLDKAMRLNYFSLLSAPRTFTTNIIGTTMAAVWRPLETMLGNLVGRGALRPDRAADYDKVFTQAMDQLTTMFDAVRRMFGGDIKFDESVAGANISTAGNSRALIGSGSAGVYSARDQVSQAWRTGRSPSTGNTAWAGDGAHNRDTGGGGFLGFLNIPTRGMAAADEAAKTVIFQSQMRAKLAAIWREQNWDDIAAQHAKDQKAKGLPPALTMEHWIDQQLNTFMVNRHVATKDAIRAHAETIHQRKFYADPIDRAKAIEEHVSNHLQYGSPYGEQAGLVGPKIENRGQLAQDVMDVMNADTFTTPLARQVEAGNLQGLPKALAHIGLSVQKLTNQFPLMKFVLPFVQTPLNLLIYASDRIPLPFVNQDFTPAVQILTRKMTGKSLDGVKSRLAKQLQSADPMVRAQAIGRMSTAFGIGGAFMGMAAGGMITGAGPNDPKQRELLKQTGWQPYSIKVGDAYVSYQRLDPFASLLGLWADTADSFRYSPEGMDGFQAEDTEDLMVDMVAAVFENIQSKSYLNGLTELFKTLNDPEKHVADMLVNKVVTPFSPNVLSAARGFTDPYLSENRDALDKFISRIPMMTGDKNVQRNVLGEKINKRTFGRALQVTEGVAGYLMPIQVNTVGSDTVDNELAALGYPLSPMRPQKWGMDLRDVMSETGQTAYDRWQELSSQVKIKGRTLRSAMERMINSRRYQSVQLRPIDEMDIDSPRVTMVRSLIAKYRRAAEAQVLKEFPELARHTQMQRMLRNSLKAGQNASSLLDFYGQ